MVSNTSEHFNLPWAIANENNNKQGLQKKYKLNKIQILTVIII